MKNNKLRLLSIIMALCLLISLAPVTPVSAWTQETVGTSLYAPDFADATTGALAPGWALSANDGVWDETKGSMSYGSGAGQLELSYDSNMAVYMHSVGSNSSLVYTSYPGMYYTLDDAQDAVVISYDMTASGSVNLQNILMPSYLNAETGAFTDLPLTMSFVGGAFTVTWDGTELVSGEKIMTTDVAKNFKIVAYANSVEEGKEIGFALYLNGEYKCGGTKLVSAFPGFNAIRLWHARNKNSKYILNNLNVDAFDIGGLSLYNLDNPPVKAGYAVDTLYQDPLQTVVSTAQTGYAFATWKQDENVLYMPDFADATNGALAPGWELSAKNSVWDSSKGSMTYGTGKGNLELSYDGNMAVYMHTGSSTQCYTSYPGMYYQLSDTQDAMVLSYDLTASSSVNLLNILMPSYLNVETGAFTDLPLTMSFDGGAFTVTWDGTPLVSGEKIMTTNVAKNFKIVAFSNAVDGGKEVGFALYINGEYKCGGTKLVSAFPGFNAIRVWHALSKNSKYTLSELEVHNLDVDSIGVYNLDNAVKIDGYVIDKLYADPLHTVESEATTGYVFATWKEDNSFLKRFDFSGDTDGALAAGWELAYGPDTWDYEAMSLPLYATDSEVTSASSGMALSYADGMHIYYKQNSVSNKYPVGMYYQLEDTYASLTVSYDHYASASGKMGQPLVPVYFDAETGVFNTLPLTIHLYAGELTVTWNGETLAEKASVPTSNSTPVNFKIKTFATAEEIGFALYINGECQYTGTAANDIGIQGFNAVRMNILSSYNCSFTVKNIMVSTDVARIGTDFYASAKAAANAAQAGDTLELLADSNDVINVNTDMTINMNGHNLAGAVIADGATLTGIDSANNDYSVAGVIANVTGAVAANAAANGRTYLAIADGSAYSFHRYYLKTSAVGINANYMADGIMQPAVFYQYALAGDQAVLDAVDSVGVAYWIDETADTVLAQSALPETCAAGAMKATAGELYTGQSAMVYGLLQEGQDVANAENIQKNVLGRAYICIGDTVIFSDNCMGNTMKHYIETADAMWDALVLSQKNSLNALYQAFPEITNLLSLGNYNKDTASAVSLLKQTLAEESTYTAVQTGGYENTENVVANGDFKNGTAGWEGYQSSVYFAKTVDGNQVLSLGRAGTVDNPFVYRELDLAPGSRCDISFRYYIESNDDAAVPCVYINCCDASGKEIETVGVWAANSIVQGQWATVSGQVDLPENASQFRVRVRVRTTADAEVYFDDIVITPQRIRLDTEDMFFYTDRVNDTVNFTAKLYDSDLSVRSSTVTFQVFNAQEQIWSSAPVAVTNGQAVGSFALAKLTELETPYTVVATAKDAAGNVIYVQTQNIYMYYRPANMAADGTFLSNGEAFYPVFGYGLSTEQIASKNVTVENAINVARLGTYTSAEGAVKALDALQNKGMKGMICLHPGMRAAGSDRNMEQTIAVIGDPRVYNHPALFGYCVQDEAFLNYHEGDPLKDLENTYRLIRMFDNIHPIMATENMPAYFDEVAQRLNCLILDQYSTAASQEVYNEAITASAVTNKPVYALTQCYLKDGVWPTADELRNNNYQYLLGGCTGLGYYRLANAGGTNKDIWDTVEDGGNPELWNAMQSFFTVEKDILLPHFGNTDVAAINQKLVKTENYWYYTFQANGNDYAVILGMMESGASAEAVVNGGFAGNTATVIAGTDAAGAMENGTLTISVSGVEAILCQIN